MENTFFLLYFRTVYFCIQKRIATVARASLFLFISEQTCFFFFVILKRDKIPLSEALCVFVNWQSFLRRQLWSFGPVPVLMTVPVLRNRKSNPLLRKNFPSSALRRILLGNSSLPLRRLLLLRLKLLKTGFF